MRLEDFEELIMRELPELMNECSDVCVEGVPPKLSLVEDIVYSGCDLCIIKSAIDRASLPTLSLTFRDGRFGEFVALDGYVIEVTEETAQLISLNEFSSRLDDLEEFGLISSEDRKVIESWLSKVSGN